MNYLVTGGSGFVGQSLCKNLIKKGHNVFNIDIITSNYNKIHNFQTNILNKNSLEQIFKNYKFDVIIHACAEVPVTKSKDFFLVNVDGTKNIIDLFKKYSVKKLVYISSSAVYGVPKKTPITERDKREPVENYGKSKKRGEDLCFKEMSRGSNITIIRPRTIIGGARLGIFSYLFEWIQNNIDVPILNNGHNKYQFVNIEDLVESVVISSKIDFVGDLNIGSSKFTTLRENLSELIKYAQSSSRLRNINSTYLFRFANLLQIIGILPLQDYHFKAYGAEIYFDTVKSKKVLNWASRFSDMQSFKQCYKNYFSLDKKLVQSPHNKKLKNIFIKYSPYLIF